MKKTKVIILSSLLLLAALTLGIIKAASVTVTEGQISGTLTIAATVTGNVDLTYRWFDSVSVSREDDGTEATFTIPTNLTADDSPYYYFCVVEAEEAEPKVSVTTVTVNPRLP